MRYSQAKGILKKTQEKGALLVSAFLLMTSTLASAAPLIIGGTASAAALDAFPSTNTQNIANNKPNVTLVSATTSGVTLQFSNFTGAGHLAYFEKRIDSITPLGLGANPNPCKESASPLNSACGGKRYLADNEVTYPGVAVTNGSVQQTIPANTKVEIRLTLGAERNYDFDWVTFTVVTPPAASASFFMASPKYVREGNFTSDIAAQINVPSSATAVRFTVNGSLVSDADLTNGVNDNDIYNISGAASGSQWYRLQKNLAAGQYSITAEFQYAGTWFPVTDSGIAYSIDLPWAEYLIPQTNKTFRPNDKVVRVKADDQYNQFNRMTVVINGVTTQVLRADCSDGGEYVLCDLQNLNLPEGLYTAVTTTYTQANNRVDNLVSNIFRIDGTAPVISNLTLTNPHPVYSTPINVSAIATDNVAVNNVRFYITLPRVSDNVCDGNGTVLANQVVTSATSTFTASLDTAGFNGTYCINAQAEDTAKNHSSILKNKVEIDNTAPTGLANVSPADNTFTTTANQTSITWTAASDSHGPVSYYYESSLNSATNVDGSFVSPAYGPASTGNNNFIATPGTPEGVYYWHVRAIDSVGNSTNWTSPWKITVDNTAPGIPTGLAFFNVNGLITNGTTNLVSTIVKWDANTDADHFEYKVWDDIAGDPFNGEANAYMDAHVPSNSRAGDFTQGEGTYTVTVRSVDVAGNASAWSTPISVTYDITAPVVTVNASSGILPTPTVTGTVDDPDATVTAAVNGMTYSATVNPVANSMGTYDWSATIADPLAVGTHEVLASATDPTGNSGNDVTNNELTIQSPLAPAIVPLASGTGNTGTNNGGTPNRITTTAFANANNAVLGAETPTTDTLATNTSNADDSKVKGESSEKQENSSDKKGGNNFLGMGWWWLLIMTALVGSGWWFIATRLKHDEN